MKGGRFLPLFKRPLRQGGVALTRRGVVRRKTVEHKIGPVEEALRLGRGDFCT